MTDGYKNTMELRALGGTAATCAFEQALNSTHKFENGKEEELAFRLPDAGDPAAVPRPSGMKDMESAMLSEVLKRTDIISESSRRMIFLPVRRISEMRMWCGMSLLTGSFLICQTL